MFLIDLRVYLHTVILYIYWPSQEEAGAKQQGNYKSNLAANIKHIYYS